jgi:ferritin-like metal-binding protein YciE
MALFSSDIKSMDELFVHELRDVYYAEQQIEKALPKMIDKATDDQLKKGFETHLEETKGQIQRLEKVFEMHGAEAKGVKCPAIDGIIKEAEEVASDVDDKDVLDAALVAAAQAVEHYEISRYGTLVTWARELGRDDCASVLSETLAEEKATDEKLTQIAESRANRKAA